MCGIAGIIHKQAGKGVNIGEQMTSMLQALKHRGPDSTGYAMYGEDNGNQIMRFKVAEAADLEGSYDIHAEIEGRLALIDSRLAELGVKVVKKESPTEYAHRYEIEFSGDMKKVADFVEDIEGVEILSIGNSLELVKDLGDAATVSGQYGLNSLNGTHGIGHTRWATHGEPSDLNAHPHTDYSGKFALIHNGIIENHATLKKLLEQKGVEFRTQTDTEVLVQLISTIYHEQDTTFETAVTSALEKVVGTYGIVVMCSDEPNQLIAARLGSPLVLGVGEGEYFIASDASPLVEYTRNVIYLGDRECLFIGDDGYKIKKLGNNEKLDKKVSRIDFTLEEIEKGNYPHFMLKEIYEQEHTIVDTMRGRLLLDEGTVHLGGIQDH